ncbi:MAG: hypothetical protein RL701_5008 [Pseudomonadota bacterium]
MHHSRGRSKLAWFGLAAAISCGSHSDTHVALDPTAGAVAVGGDAEPVAGQGAGSGVGAEAGRLAAGAGSAGSSLPAPSGVTQPVQPQASAGSRAHAGMSAGGSSGVPAVAGQPASAGSSTTLFYLDNVGGRVLRAADGGQDQDQVIVANAGVGPDGVAVDVAHGHVFWTNMGVANADDGKVMRADLDGKNPTTIVATGTFTPKQLKLDAQGGKLYWSDREGMRVMRANLDGSQLETLIVTGASAADRRDASRWCVGIAIDVAGKKLYWTQKGGDNAGQGTIKRANLELPAGADPARRNDIEVLFANLPEPIDLDLDLEQRFLYWTDRGDNTISRAPLDLPAGADPAKRTDREILLKGLGEAIGISLAVNRSVMYYTSLGGVVARAALDGSAAKSLLTSQGAVTGIVWADL